MNEQEHSDIVHKFRDEAAALLTFHPCIELLMDNAFCKGLDRIIHKSGVMWERKIANDTLGASLPDQRGLYMFVWRPELSFRFASAPQHERMCWALYVGKAGTEEGQNDTIKNRYEGEYCKYVGKDASCLWDAALEHETRQTRLSRFLTLRPMEYWFLTIDSVRDILLLERKLIKLLRPPLNYHHGTKIRPGKTVPAFEEPK